MAVNMCCVVPPFECSTKHSVYNHVMRFKKKMAEINEEDASGDEESPPPTPTPV